jgi:glucokinase
MRKGLRLGVDLGGTSVKLALVDERGRLHDKVAVDTVKQPRALVKRLSEAVRPWSNRSLLGTGVGVAGDVDSQKGVVRFSANLGWRRVSLAALFRKFKFPAPIVLDNDANAAAWGGYHLELGARPKSLITLTLGTGVGGGLVLNGQVYRGVTGSAGEIGHLVVQEGGDPCACGNRGCLESYLGASAMVRWARAAYAKKKQVVEPLDPKILEQRALRRDPVAQEAYARAARALGTALTSLVNLLNPDTILLTGGVARGAGLFLPQAMGILKSGAFKTPARAVRVVVARGKSDLGVAGAGLLVI